MATQSEIETKIAQLDSEIAAGVQEVIVDGTKTKVSVEAKQAERTRLQRRLNAMRRKSGSSFARPVDLGGF